MVLNGLDHLADAAPWLRGRRLGLITSTSGITRTLAPGIDAIQRCSGQSTVYAVTTTRARRWRHTPTLPPGCRCTACTARTLSI